MHRLARRSGTTLALVLLVTSATGFSLSRSLHGVDQDVADDGGLYSSQELRADMDLAEQPQRNQLEQYVTIKESPGGFVSVPRGHRLELKCEVDGSPPPRVYWVRGEDPGRQVEMLEREAVAEMPYSAIAREASRLVVECAGPQDQSLVHCVGVSGDKMAISQPVVVSVQGNGSWTGCSARSSAPEITRHRPLYFSEMGSTAVLPCEAEGSPRPHVHWLDGEGKPVSDPRFSVQPDGSLVIANIRWSDMDGYKCVAQSAHGRAEAVTFLYPAAKVRNFSFLKSLVRPLLALLRRVL